MKTNQRIIDMRNSLWGKFIDKDERRGYLDCIQTPFYLKNDGIEHRELTNEEREEYERLEIECGVMLEDLYQLQMRICKVQPRF